MTMHKLIAATLLVLAAVPAHARTFVLTATGTINGSSGIPAGTALGNDATIVIMLDDTLGRYTQYGSSFVLDGGSGVGISNPVLGTRFTSGTFAYAFVPTVGAELMAGSDRFSFSAISYSGGVSELSISYPGGGSLFPTTLVPFDVATPDTFAQLTYAAPGRTDGVSVAVNRIALALAVPEPGSWALLIGGFGAIGAISRRRRMLVPADGRRSPGPAAG